MSEKIRLNTTTEFHPQIEGTILGQLPSELIQCIVAFRPSRVGHIKGHYEFKYAFGKYGKEQGMLSSPWTVAFDPINGNPMVVEHQNHRIQSFSPQGESLSFVNLGASGNPLGMVFQSNGNLVISEYGGATLKIFSPLGGLIRTITGVLLCPYDVTVDEEDNIYVADAGHGLIQTFTAQGETAHSFGKSETQENPLSYPTGVVYSNGNLIVTDNSTYTITMWTTKGEFIREITKVTTGSSPFRSAVDATGHIVVPSYSPGTIHIFSPEGKQLQVISTGGPGHNLGSVVAVSLDGEGKIYASDYSNHKVMVFG